MPKKGILERLSEGPVIGDGGYLLELERRGYVKAGPFTPEVAVEAPEALRQLHSEFLRAGSQVLQACTFYASEEKLRTAGYAQQVEQINRAAVRIAREVAGDQALVAGNLSLTWQYDPDKSSSKDRVLELFRQQVALQKEEGVDFAAAGFFGVIIKRAVNLARKLFQRRTQHGNQLGGRNLFLKPLGFPGPRNAHFPFDFLGLFQTQFRFAPIGMQSHGHGLGKIAAAQRNFPGKNETAAFRNDKFGLPFPDIHPAPDLIFGPWDSPRQPL